ncbi:AraC family transcriptional regulator [Phreatobacter sp. AB_2022a]|uniref:AraC family transcriptional regulator n=1 Tax=Phreatobacter sp. AB_2022a TaxID=3003134 RepID=UPI002287450B|nr:helix-turn-helix domain-containing protein [Phreatobacter sp. AB_2022a]MCZ0732971.1 helix-turn-helix domain-containing protein [Phreatobacter sp. AB_2022a]
MMRQEQAGERFGRTAGTRLDPCLPMADTASFYVELAPRDRRRNPVDHLFMLHDCGRLIGAEAKLFSSPFLEICLVGRRQAGGAGETAAPLAWTAVCRKPRFGQRPRSRPFHGWMLGFRCRPLDIAWEGAALLGLARSFVAEVEGGATPDAIAHALDDWAGAVCAALAVRTDTGRGRPADEPAADPVDRCLAALAPGRAASVMALAASTGLAPRTLQRRFLSRAGLPPKRLMTLQRFTRAMAAIASGGNLAQVALEAGYCDQAHLSADLKRHAGLSPSRFRALAERQVMPAPVRFFQDEDLQQRARLVMRHCAEEIAGDELRSQGPRFRRPRPRELRAPDGHDEPRNRDR